MAKKKSKKREFVKGHIRHMATGKPVKVKGYRRKLQKSGKSIPFRENYEVIYYRDSGTGRLVSKRKYKSKARRAYF